MTVAILLTGALRNIDYTLEHISSLCRDSASEVLIFAAVDTDSETLVDLVRRKLSPWICAFRIIRKVVSQEIDHARISKRLSELPSSLWSRTHNKEWVTDYLCSRSGSLIESRQIAVAIRDLREWEESNHVRFNTAYRVRTDAVPLEPFQDLSSLSSSTIHPIAKSAFSAYSDSSLALTVAMSALYAPARLLYDFSTKGDYPEIFNVTSVSQPFSNWEQLACFMQKQLESGKFYIGFRLNTFFIAGRETLDVLEHVYSGYAFTLPKTCDIRLGNENNWWDVEHQIYHHLRDSDHPLFSTCTDDEAPLGWDFRRHMFNPDRTRVLKNSPSASFFFWRPPV